MAKHYGYKIWDVRRLTFKQVDAYMSNLQYVLDMSGANKYFGKPPEIQPPPHELVDLAIFCGIQVPFNVHYDLTSLQIAT